MEYMKKTLFLLTGLLIALAGPLTAQSPADKICGTWVTEEGTSHIKIYEQGGKYHGKVVWLKEPRTSAGQPKKDIHNPNSRLRDRPIMGLVILSDLRYKGGTWEDGEIYAPEKGKTLDCEVELVGSRKLELTVSQGFFSRTKTMTRL